MVTGHEWRAVALSESTTTLSEVGAFGDHTPRPLRDLVGHYRRVLLAHVINSANEIAEICF